ncbi:MAG: hypothetical protein ACREMF_09700 [Gemmatimonadales bacterium]
MVSGRAVVCRAFGLFVVVRLEAGRATGLDVDELTRAVFSGVAG